MMRKDRSGQLIIRCPECRKGSNEYNWTLKTAAHFSIGEDTCPTVIQVLLAALAGEGDYFDGFRMICPRCNYGVDFTRIEMPAPEAVREYARAVGEDYCQGWY